MANDLKKLMNRINEFRDARDWRKFHNPKDLALSMMLEAAEVVEHFQWKNKEELEEYAKNRKEKIAEEIADVFNYLLILCDELKVDIIEVSHKKIDQNEKKYPIEKAKGKHTKYTEL